MSGYNAAVATDDLAPLARELGQVPPTWRGFAFEGAGMSLWLQDSLSLFRRDRWKGFQSEHAPEHAYLLHVGAGWAMCLARSRFTSFFLVSGFSICPSAVIAWAPSVETRMGKEAGGILCASDMG